MLRCTFRLDLRQALRMTHPAHTVHGALFVHYIAVIRGSDLAAKLGFTEGHRESHVNHFGGMKCDRVKGARCTGDLIMKALNRRGLNG